MSRFGGKLVLVLLDDKTHGVTRDGRSLWALERLLSYWTEVGGTGTIFVPAGFVTDLASIPRLMSGVLPPDGPWLKAAIVHDFLYATQGSGVWKGHPPGITRPAPYSREQADAILREAMEDRGVGAVQRALIWSGVRVGGAKGWGR